MEHLNLQCTKCSKLTDELANCVRPGPEVIKPFSCSTELSMKFLKVRKYKNI